MTQFTDNEAVQSGSQAARILRQRIKDGTLREIWQDWKWIWSFSRGRWVSILLYTLLGIASSGIALAAGIASKYLIDCILQFVALNKNNFITDENDFYQPKTPFGKINKGSSETVITILKSKADEVFKENNISDSRNLLNILKEKRCLIPKKTDQVKDVELLVI